MQDASTFELRTLGRITLRHAEAGTEARSILAQPKRLALLLYLALGRPRGRHPRDTLLALFWPESDQERARRALNQAVYVLRRTLGPDALVTESDGSLSLGPELRVDALELEAAVEEGRPEEAIDLYEGDFAPGFHVDAGAAFERWLDVERERLRRLALSAALEHSEALVRAGDVERAAAILRLALEWAPLDEDVVRSLVKVLLAAGDRTGAAVVIEGHERAIAERLEIEVAPNAALRALVEGATPGAAARPVSGPSPAELRSPGPPSRTSRRTLVTRIAGVAVPVVVVAAAGAVILSGDRGPAPGTAAADARMTDGTRPRVLVMPFDGPEETALLSRMARDWLVQGMAETGLVQVARSLESGRTGDGRAGARSPLAVRAEARRMGASHLILGSLVPRGDSLLLQVQLVDSAGGVLRSTMVAGLLDDPLGAVDELRRRGLVMMALALDPELRRWAATTTRLPTYEAYVAYADALGRYPGFTGSYSSPAYAEAAEAFEAAAALDSTFEAPLVWALRAYDGAERIDDVARLVDRLTPHRATLSPWERAMLDLYAGKLEGDQRRALDAARRAVSVSSDPESLMSLAEASLSNGDPAAAVAVLTAARDTVWLRSAPGYWSVLTEAHHMLGDFAAELEASDRWRRAMSDDPFSVAARVRALAGLDRPQEAVRVAEEALPRWRMEPTRIFHTLPNALLWHGHPDEAERLASAVLAWHEERPPGLRDWTYAHFHALLLQRLSRPDEAVEVLAPVVEEHPTPWNVGQFGVAAATAGHHELAVETAERLAHMVDAARRVEAWPTPLVSAAWRASVLAHLGQVERGLGLLHDAVRQGLPYGAYLHTRMELGVFRGEPSLEALLRPGSTSSPPARPTAR